MANIQRLQISHLRNLSQVAIDLSPGINLFYGANGSGKTSLLEAVSLIGMGRSFRSHKNRPLIQFEASELVVFAEVLEQEQKIPVGLQKNRQGQTKIKLAGDTIQSAVPLAQQLPLQIIDANAFALIEGSPTQRRRFLDWIVFHVKPEFIDLWRRLQRALKQRNQLLRSDKITSAELEPWDKELSTLATSIHQLREEVFKQLLDHLTRDDLLENFAKSTGIDDIQIGYIPGWDIEKNFEQVLLESFSQDCQSGYTRHGPQRADISIKVSGKPAADILSRGQEKALICALHLAQARMFREQRGQSCTFLVDDLLAELDSNNASCLARWLTKLETQVLVTGIEKELLQALWKQEGLEPPKVFHVEQGGISVIRQSPQD